jgi:hypothetical protein
MATKHYAIFDPTTGLYSQGVNSYHQNWTTLDAARVWDRLRDAKIHVTYCNKGVVMSYVAPMEIVEVERVYTNKGLAEKI